MKNIFRLLGIILGGIGIVAASGTIAAVGAWGSSLVIQELLTSGILEGRQKPETGWGIMIAMFFCGPIVGVALGIILGLSKVYKKCGGHKVTLLYVVGAAAGLLYFLLQVTAPRY